MPALSIDTSPNIASLDSHIVGSLCDGKFYIDVADSIFIGSGALEVLGVSVKVTSPTGVIIKNYPTSGYDIYSDSPPFSTIIEVNIPTQASNYQYGTYKVEVRMTDADGTEYTLEKTIKLCEPDKNHKTRNYGSLSATMKGTCKDDKLYITLDTPPNYNGKEVESQVNDTTLLYPTVSELDPIEDIELSSFSVQLYEGQYKLTGTVCATYNYGDNVYVEVNYKIKKEKIVKCELDECCVAAGIAELNAKANGSCTEVEQKEFAVISAKVLLILKVIELKAICGEDPSDDIIDLESILGCQCTCNCNEGTPIINNDPAKDFAITGCGVEKTTVGLTDSYVINNYSYEVYIAPNGGALVASAAEIQDCVVTIPITFDISKVYNQIKALANTDYLSWASILNKAWNGIDPSCMGLTTPQWSSMSFAQRGQALADAACTGGTCAAEIDNDEVDSSGADAVFTWEYAVRVGADDNVEIYIDDVLVGTVKATKTTFTAVGYADGSAHTYSLVSKCSNGVSGNALDGSFEFFGCPTIAVPTVTLSNISDADCPYDLTELVNALPSGIEAEWHNANNTNAATLVSDPENAADGVYYVFAKNSDNCYSLGVKVILVCSVDTNCSAPQNLIVEDISGGFRVRFQSAAFAPPSNSYTVKRRLESDPDVDGSYTTIGTPTYNSTVNRWEILDASASDNILYVYRAISNCTSSAPYIDYEFANIDCPLLSLTPTDTEMAYSFVPVGGGVTKYEVEIYNFTKTTRISYDTKLPSFSNPITGTFPYLTAGTTYWVRVKIYIGDYVTICLFKNGTTDGMTFSDGTIEMVDSGNGEAISMITFNDEEVSVEGGYVIPEGNNTNLSVSNKALAGELVISITGHTGGTTTRIEVTDSNSNTQCLPIAANGDYTFSAVDIVDGDPITIEILTGGTCP